MSDDIPLTVRQAARSAVLDTIAVILAGSREPVSRIVADAVAEDGAHPVADCLGIRLRTSMEGAALVNGVSGHALDYDDVSRSAIGHPSVVIVPAAFAAAQATGATGRAFLDAYVVGVEVMAKLGQAMGQAHYQAGWHITSTVGTLAAAMAAGRLFGLDEDRLGHALAIAVSQAGGSRQNFGTMTKPFHPGHAARCGIHAARLAGKGLTGDAAILEAPLGFFSLFGLGEAHAGRLAEALGRPFELDSPGLSVKRYPCCYATHRAADATLELITKHDVMPAEVAGVEVTVPPGGLAPLIRDTPRTGLEGKFSMAYVVAAAILDRGLSLDTFTDAQVGREEARALLRIVRVREDAAIRVTGNAIEEGYVLVQVRLGNGRALECRIAYPRGSPERPLTHTELLDKFRDCARRALPPEQIERAAAALDAIETARRLDDVVTPLLSAGAS